MLADVIIDGFREPVADGVFLCRFPKGTSNRNPMNNTDTGLSTCQNFELFFCCKGAFVIQKGNDSAEQVCSEDIILLADDVEDKLTIEVQKPVVGYSVVVCAQKHSAINRIYQALDFSLQWNEPVQEFLSGCNGCFHVRQAFWKQGVFSVLQSLPDWDQPTFCILKAAELFYLLSSQQIAPYEGIQKFSQMEYGDDTFGSVRIYIEKHLDEKLTIPMLCQRFNLSPTTLKNKFRQTYGQPVHSWILACRLQRAAELLQFTNLKILQVAQTVGYESASQFNVAFRKTYGVSPTQYRKNVRYNKKQADSVGKTQ